MRNRQLHAALAAFAEEASWQLQADTADGAEVPFEVVASGRKDSPLYCYRPLTGAFIEERIGLFDRLESFALAVHALARVGGLEDYLQACGERGYPAQPRARAEFALRVFLGRVFADSTDFELTHERLERAYAELERAAYEGRTDTVVVAPLIGLQVASRELALADGMSLVHGDAFEEDLPDEALWAPGARHAHLLAVLRWEEPAGDVTPVAHARVGLRRLLAALRLFDAGAVGFGPLAWTRTGSSAWEPFALGTPAPRAGELAWSLRRFEMACERPVPGEALSDVLLALRALLEPEGASSGLLAGRLGALCAVPDDRAALTARIAHTVALERAVVAGAGVDPALDTLVAELTGHLRAILRDVLCGHLDAEVRAVADAILAQARETERERRELDGVGPEPSLA